MAALIEGPHRATLEAIVLEAEAAKIHALHARPAGPALGGVVVVPDIGGLRPLYEDMCRRLATHGLAVCAVELFSRLSDGPDGPMLDVETRRARAGELYDDFVMEDLAEAADHLAAHELDFISPEASRSTAAATVVIGTVLFESAFITMRRLAQEHHSAIRFSGSVARPPGPQ
jgi:hypothetical protein